MYELVPIHSDEVWKTTLDTWKEEAYLLGEEGSFVAQEIESNLLWQKEYSKKDPNAHSYFMVKGSSSSSCACSTLDFSHAMPKSSDPWLKLLGVKLRPKYLPRVDAPMTTEQLRDACAVLACSVIKGIDLIDVTHPSTQLKVYGRTPEMLQFFQGVILSDELNDVLVNLSIEAKLEGKWLVLSQKGER